MLELINLMSHQQAPTLQTIGLPLLLYVSVVADHRFLQDPGVNQQVQKCQKAVFVLLDCSCYEMNVYETEQIGCGY